MKLLTRRARPWRAANSSIDWSKAKVDLAIAFLSQFFYKVAGYAVLFVLVRHLTKNDMGQYFFAASLASSAVLFTELGLGAHLVRTGGAHPEHVQDRLTEVLGIRLPLLGLYFIALNAGVAVIRPALLEISILTSIYVGLLGLYSTFGSLFLAVGKVTWTASVGVLTQGLLVILVWIASRNGVGLLGVLVAHVAVDALLVGLGLWKAWPWVRQVRLGWPGSRERRVLRGAFPLFLVALLQILHFKIDTVMLGFLKPYDEVAAYEAGSRLLEASQFVLRPLSMIFLPLCASLAARGAWVELRRLFRNTAGAVGGMGTAIALGVLLLAGIVVPIVFGVDYRSTIPVLRILYLSVPGLYVGSVCLLLLTAAGRESDGARILGVGVALNVAMNLFAIPSWGAAGAAWATLGSQTLTGVWLVRATVRVLDRPEGTRVSLAPEAAHVA